MVFDTQAQRLARRGRSHRPRACSGPAPVTAPHVAVLGTSTHHCALQK